MPLRQEHGGVDDISNPSRAHGKWGRLPSVPSNQSMIKFPFCPSSFVWNFDGVLANSKGYFKVIWWVFGGLSNPSKIKLKPPVLLNASCLGIRGSASSFQLEDITKGY